MKIILMGAPGSGKGTQAEFLKNKLGIPHISTGEIFRENMKNNTDLGKRAGEYIVKGLLVPDEVTCDMLFNRLEEEDCKNGYILDGFPRTIHQAVILDKQLTAKGYAIDKVINIHVPDENVIRRLSGRRVCSNCGATYHIDYEKPTKEGLCDVCGSALIQRKDDSPDTIKARLVTYHQSSEPLIGYYKEKGLLAVIDGTRDVDHVSQDILTALG